MLLKVTDELLKEVQQETFGPCSVVYESMTLEELHADLLGYLTESKVRLIKGQYVTYKSSLTLTTFKQWLKLRITVEEMDAYPEHPFDRTDEQIERQIRGRKALLARLNTNVNNLMKKLRSVQS
jgi:hypothetical protein